MAFLSLLASILAFAASLIDAQVTWNAVPYNPSAIPLAVRSPYLSTWLPQGGGKTLFSEWSTFWNGDVRCQNFHRSRRSRVDNLSQITGWAGYLRVDGTAYVYMGGAGAALAPVQKSVTVGHRATKPLRAERQSDGLISDRLPQPRAHSL